MPYPHVKQFEAVSLEHQLQQRLLHELRVSRAASRPPLALRIARFPAALGRARVEALAHTFRYSRA